MLRITLCIAFALMSATAPAQQRELGSLLTALADHPKDDTIRLNLLNDIAFSCQNIDPAKGLVAADQAIALAKKLNNKVKLADAYSQKGINYWAQGENSLALIAYKQASGLHQQAGNQLGVARASHNTGMIYFDRADYPEALKHHLKAATIFSKLGDRRSMAYALNSVGLNYMYLSNYPKAVDYYLRALKLAEQSDNKLMIASTSTNLGLVHTRLAAYDKALVYHNKALQLNEQLDNKRNIAGALGNIASVYGYMNEEKKAIEQYQRALIINKAVQNKRGQASDLINIGISYTELTDYFRALPYLQQALRLFEELGNKTEMSLAVNYMATIYRQAPDQLLKQQGVSAANRYATAISYHKQGLQLAKEVNDLASQSEYWENLSKTYTAQRNFSDALTAYRQHITLRDSIVNTEKKEEIARKEVQAEFEKKEAVARAEYAKKQAITVAEIGRQRTVNNSLMGGAAGLALASAFGFALYKRKREADEQAKESELKAEIADTEMKALRAQMNPHFIFNSLNSISDYVIKNDVKTADYYLTKFAKLMRLILQNSEKKQVTLADDLEALELYMQLEAMRMHFTYAIEVDDALDPDETLIPPPAASAIRGKQHLARSCLERRSRENYGSDYERRRYDQLRGGG